MPKFLVETGRKSTNNKYNIRKKTIQELQYLLTLKLSQKDYTSAVKILETQAHCTGIKLSYLWKAAYEVIKQYTPHDTNCLRFLQNALKAGIPNSVEIIKEILYYNLKTSNLRNTKAILESYMSNPLYFKEADIYGYSGIIHIAIRESEISNTDSKKKLAQSNNLNLLKTDDTLLSFENIAAFDDFLILTPQDIDFDNQKNDSDNEIELSYRNQSGSYELGIAEKHLKEAIRIDKSGTLYLYYLIQIYVASFEFKKAEILLDDLLLNATNKLVFLKFAAITQYLAANHASKKLKHYQTQFSNKDYSSQYSSDIDIGTQKSTAKTTFYGDDENEDQKSSLKKDMILYNSKFTLVSGYICEYLGYKKRVVQNILFEPV
ncbi:hypothetical protein BB561_000488 [Smittium simulii]|uniref:Uncharacterized protein n=1 Tax=Smittium simulii TaxID=133385 RepID=A0A2T9YZ28_9FUNG|nr:hypothetical protein BB561_000488 [Smittium simulii]